MSNKFKQQAAVQRAAVPQVDLEASPSREERQPEKVKVAEGVQSVAAPAPPPSEKAAASEPVVRLTLVDTSERPVSHGFQMYPSRHRQLAKDLAYIEDRNPWLIIDDALEEYVVRHYGKGHKRR